MGLADQDRVVDILRRFSHFVDGYLAVAPGRAFVVADVRYSMDTSGFSPMWGVWVDPTDPIDPVAWVGFVSDRGQALAQLWEEILGRREGFNPPSAGQPVSGEVHNE